MRKECMRWMFDISSHQFAKYGKCYLGKHERMVDIGGLCPHLEATLSFLVPLISFVRTR